MKDKIRNGADARSVRSNDNRFNQTAVSSRAHPKVLAPLIPAIKDASNLQSSYMNQMNLGQKVIAQAVKNTSADYQAKLFERI